MKSERLRTVKHWQVGNESTNLVELLESRNLVADVELELVVEDGVGEPDLQQAAGSRNSSSCLVAA